MGSTLVKPFNNSQLILESIQKGDWDIAVVSEAHKDQLSQLATQNEFKPHVIDTFVTGSYILRSSANLDEIDEVYHFGGKQSSEALDRLLEDHPHLENAKLSRGTTPLLAQLTQQLSRNAGIFVQDPLGSIYSELLPGERALADLDKVHIQFMLLGSTRFLRTAGPEGLTQIADMIRAAIKVRPDDLLKHLIEDGILEKLNAYLIERQR